MSLGEVRWSECFCELESELMPLGELTEWRTLNVNTRQSLRQHVILTTASRMRQYVQWFGRNPVCLFMSLPQLLSWGW
jgi:hypothetical protein